MIIYNNFKLDAINSFARELLKNKIKKNSKRLKNPPVWLYPKSIERSYIRELLKMVKFWKESAKEIIIPRLERIVNQAGLQNIKQDSLNIKLDQYPEDIENIMKIYLTKINTINDDVRNKIQESGLQTSDFNRSQWLKITNSVIGIPLYQNEPWLSDSLRSYNQENVKLITKLSEDIRSDIETTINRGIREGKVHGTIAKEILEGTELKKGIFAKAETRAKLIARDQVSKWNGQLTRIKQQDAGVTQYQWKTSFDERVRGKPGGKYPNARPSHWAMENKICSWSDTSIYKDTFDDKSWKKRSSIGGVQLHPGQDIQCRCSASPILESIEILQ